MKCEPVKRFPRPTELGFEDDLRAAVSQAKRFVGRGLLDLEVQAQRRCQGQTAESDIGYLGLPIQVDAQEHVRSGQDSSGVFHTKPAASPMTLNPIVSSACYLELQPFGECQ